MKGLVIEAWLGLFVPAGTPPGIVARLNSEIGTALVDPAVRASLLQSAQEPIGGTAQDLSAIIRGDSEKYARLTRELNIKVE